MDVKGSVVLFTTGPVLHGLYGLQHLLGRTDAPCVGIIHSLHGSTLLPPFLGSMLQRSRSADALICSSVAGRTVVEGQLRHLAQAANLKDPFPFRCPIIPVGIDAEYFHEQDRNDARRQCGISNGEVVILSIGRFSSRTKADLRPLILAFAQVKASCPRQTVRLILAGDDTQEHESRALLRFGQRLDIEASMSIRPDIAHSEKILLLGAADIFAAPSDNMQETFGSSVVEAMAAGLPVVAADWDGFKDTVVHEETGIRVPCFLPRYDSSLEALGGVGGALAEVLSAQTTCIEIPALVSALKRLVENVEYRRKLGDQARLRAQQNYHISRVVGQYEELWDELLRQPFAPEPKAPQKPLFTYNPCDIFGDHGTGLLSGVEMMHLSKLGQEALQDSSLLAEIADNEQMFRMTDLKRLLCILRETGGEMSIAQLASSGVADDRLEQLALRAATLRLLKFGFLSLSEEPEDH